MKKGIIILIVVVLLLCAIATVGGSAIWYFFLRNTPQKAFDKAVANLDEADYYQQEYEGTIDARVTLPDYPEYDVDMEMEVSGEAKVDNKNNKKYLKSIGISEGSSQTTEYYWIEDDVYMRLGSGSFEKLTEEEASNLNTGSGTTEYAYLSGKDNYTILEEEEIDGVNCYHYNVPLDDEDLSDFIDNFMSTFEDSNVTVNDVTVSDASLEMWISKDNSFIMKTINKIGNISTDSVSEGIDMVLIMEDIEIDSTFSGWNEEVEIEAPV